MKRTLIIFLLLTTVSFGEEEKRVSIPNAGPSLEILSLESCVQRTLENNYSILQAKARVEREQGTFIVARSQALPQIYINGELDQSDPNRAQAPFGGTPLGPLASPTAWDMGINLEQLIYAGGKVRAGIQIARLREDRSLLDFQRVVNETLLSVRERFFTILLNKQQIEVQKQALQLLEEQLKTVQSKYYAGTLSRFNVLRAEVEVANAKPALIRAQNNFRLSLEDMARLLGIPDRRNNRDMPFLIEGALEKIPFQMDLETALNTADERRPEIKALRKQQLIQEKNILVQQAGLKPTVSTFVNYDYIKETFANQFDRENHGWMVGLKVKIPIFDGLETHGKVKEAQADLKLATLEIDETLLTVAFEVRQAYLAIEEAIKLIEASEKADEEANESLRLVTARFDVGAATQLEVLDARVALTSARLNSLQALYDYNVALARLKKATGIDNVYQYQPQS